MLGLQNATMAVEEDVVNGGGRVLDQLRCGKDLVQGPNGAESTRKVAGGSGEEEEGKAAG
jgi:hypothetical protein